MENLIPSEYQQAFNEVRILVLIETKPLSNTYVQMEFSRNQFVAIRKFIEGTWRQRFDNIKEEGFIVKCKDGEIPIPMEGISTWYK